MLNSQQQLLTRQEAAKYLVEKFMPILSLKLSSNRNFCKNIHTLPINEHPDFSRKIDDRKISEKLVNKIGQKSGIYLM